MSDLAALLRGTDTFARLDENGLQLVAARMIRRTYAKGQLLFSQGDPGGSLFVVRSGLLGVSVVAPTGERVLLNTLGPGGVLGEVALLDGGDRSATAEALEPTVVFALPREAFLRLVQDRPAIVEGLLHGLGALVRRLTDQMADFVILDLPGRVAKALVRLAEDHPRGSSALPEVTLAQGRLAEMAGGSRQSVNSILQQFRARGLVDIRERRIVLRDPAALRRRAYL